MPLTPQNFSFKYMCFIENYLVVWEVQLIKGIGTYGDTFSVLGQVKFKNPFSNIDRFLIKWLQIQLQEFNLDLGSCEHNDGIQISENSGSVNTKMMAPQIEAAGEADGKLPQLSVLKGDKFNGWWSCPPCDMWSYCTYHCP